MGTLSNKLDYLGTTKYRIYEGLKARGFDVTDNMTFRDVANLLYQKVVEDYADEIDVSSVNEYWENEIKDAIIYVLLNDDCIHHVVATDCHYRHNNNESVGIIKILQDTGLFSKIINIGDIADGHGTSTASADETKAYEMWGQFNGDLLFAIGNHDYSSDSAPRFYEELLSESEDLVGSSVSTNLAYYWDDEENKIRYFVDSLSANSIITILNAANIMSLPTGWRYIVISHYHPLRVLSNYTTESIDTLKYYDLAGQQNNSQLKIADSTQFLFPALTGHDCIGRITGHLHDDGVDTILDGNIVQVTLANDGNINDNVWYRKVANSKDSQAITIMSIGKNSQTVKFYRIGRIHRLGKQFSYSYKSAKEKANFNGFIQGIELDTGGYTFKEDANAVQLMRRLPSKDKNGNTITYYFISEEVPTWIVYGKYTASGEFVERITNNLATVTGQQPNYVKFKTAIASTSVDGFILAAVEYANASTPQQSFEVFSSNKINDACNRFDENTDWVETDLTEITFDTDVEYNAYGVMTAYSNAVAFSKFLRVHEGETYTFTTTSNRSVPWLYFNLYRTPVEYIFRQGKNTSTTQYSVTIPSGINYMTFSVENMKDYVSEIRITKS